MNNIGQLMQASTILNNGIDNPVSRLRSLVDDMRNQLRWYKSKYPDADTTKRWQLIQELELILQTLEKCEPIGLVKLIHEKLEDAYRDKFNPNCAQVWLPLTTDLDVHDLSAARPAIIDLIGWDIRFESQYDLIGSRFGKYICSDEEERI
jgi:hypothetical protein